MGTWNYRVVRERGEYGIREVYYEDERVKGWTAAPDGPFGETQEELVYDLARMGQALTRPVLDITTGQAVEIGVPLVQPGPEDVDHHPPGAGPVSVGELDCYLSHPHNGPHASD